MRRLIAAIVAMPCATLAAPLADPPALNPGELMRQESGEVTVAGIGTLTVVRYVWSDSAGRPRSVSLVPASGATAGYAVQMTYQLAGGSTVRLDADAAADGGFGYFVSHELFRNFADNDSNTIAAKFGGEDDSPLGRYLASTGSASSVGLSQATHEFRLSYPRWGTKAAVPDPDVAVLSTNPADYQRFVLPVVIRWHFVAGFDHPLWTVDYDLTGKDDLIATDVRGPYGAMHFNNGSGPEVTRLRWGDWYHFDANAGAADFGTTAYPAGGLAWSWSAVNNGRRYNVMSSGTFELGLVDTTIARSASSKYGDGYSPSRTLTSATKVSECVGDASTMRALPCPYEWAYQSFQYDFGPPTRAKLAWGTSPFLGSSLTAVYNGVESVPFQGTGRISYGVHIVMGSSAGASITTTRAAAPIETNPVLTIASSPANGGTIAYTVLGDAGGPYTTSRTLAPWNSVRLVATPAAGFTFSNWNGPCVGVAGPVCMATLQSSATATAVFSPIVGGSGLQLSPATLNFGMWPMTIASTAQPITVTNAGNTTATISSIGVTGPFSQTNNCTTLAAGASCTVDVTFLPPVVADPALQASAGHVGSLVVTSNAAGSPNAATLGGGSERSLLTHYYRNILRRDVDGSGSIFWRGETSRVVGLGANVNEAWFAMAQAFFGSAEYAAFNRDAAGFVTDLYRTFFNRAPDAPGLAFWTGQMAQGMPREVVLSAFLFSNEFVAFTQGIFGNTAARAEIDVTMDFYRGLLSRLPDTGGFNFWVGQFRTAQCPAPNPALAVQQAEGISSAFVNSGEYAGRGRSNAQFVGDLYNAFLRRGGDLGGVLFWIQQLDGAALTRDQVRAAFRASGEFAARANAIAGQGCL